jgi:hypothetical protein
MLGAMTMSEKKPQKALPVILAIPPSTLEELRARRSRRSGRTPAPSVPIDRPILRTVDLAMRATESGPHDAASTFCEDMDRLQAEVEEKYDAFLLDPGMGPMTYITSDGRILSDYRTWDGEGIRFETSLDVVVGALVAGSMKTGIASLLNLIPPLENGVPCSTCNGTRWFQLQNGKIVCPMCSGRGECAKV